MGWAKYTEDNMEIVRERLSLMTSCSIENTSFILHESVILPSKVVHTRKPTPQPKNDADEYIVCWDCGKKFLFSADAKKIYKSRGWTRPKRCKFCREAKKFSIAMGSRY